MFKPELYQKSNSAPRKDSMFVLQTYASKLKSSSNDSIVDLGCGDGGVTTDILKKFLPADYKQLVGCDIGQKMITYANENCSDEKTTFQVLDLAGELPLEWKNAFDHAFSFYAIHWIQDQEKAFRNIYDLLSDRGDCLLMFVGFIPIYDVYRLLARNQKWQQWLKDVDYYISPYQDSKEPEKEVRKLMADSGFKNIDIKCVKRTYNYSEQDFKNVIEAICPFKIPSDLKDEYMEDYMQHVKDFNILHQVENRLIVKLDYTLLVAYGRKQ